MAWKRTVLTAAMLLPVAISQDPVRQLDAMLLPSVEAKLDSENGADVAWGGYLAQRYQLRGATRKLVTALGRWQEKHGLKARFVRLHLADALVAIRASVPGERMSILLRDPLTRSSAFAILANDPRVNHGALVDLATSRAPWGDTARRGAARLLVAKKQFSPKLGKHVLANLNCKLNVVIKDGAEDENQWNSAVGLGGSPPKEIGAMPGFPPLVRLTAYASASADDTVRLLVPDRFGDEPFVLSRQEGVTYQQFQMRAGEKQDTDHASEYAKLVGAMTRVYFKSYETIDLDWAGKDDYVKKVTELRDTRRKNLDKAVSRMRRDGWLGKEDLSGFRIPLEIATNDLRADKSEALPELPPVPAASSGK